MLDVKLFEIASGEPKPGELTAEKKEDFEVFVRTELKSIEFDLKYSEAVLDDLGPITDVRFEYSKDGTVYVDFIREIPELELAKRGHLPSFYNTFVEVKVETLGKTEVIDGVKDERLKELDKITDEIYIRLTDKNSDLTPQDACVLIELSLRQLNDSNIKGNSILLEMQKDGLLGNYKNLKGILDSAKILPDDEKNAYTVEEITVSVHKGKPKIIVELKYGAPPLMEKLLDTYSAGDKVFARGAGGIAGLVDDLLKDGIKPGGEIYARTKKLTPKEINDLKEQKETNDFVYLRVYVSGVDRTGGVIVRVNDEELDTRLKDGYNKVAVPIDYFIRDGKIKLEIEPLTIQMTKKNLPRVSVETIFADYPELWKGFFEADNNGEPIVDKNDKLKFVDGVSEKIKNKIEVTDNVFAQNLLRKLFNICQYDRDDIVLKYLEITFESEDIIIEDFLKTYGVEAVFSDSYNAKNAGRDKRNIVTGLAKEIKFIDEKVNEHKEKIAKLKERTNLVAETKNERINLNKNIQSHWIKTREAIEKIKTSDSKKEILEAIDYLLRESNLLIDKHTDAIISGKGNLIKMLYRYKKWLEKE